jgi:Ca2+-binding RTX toxin-like protein
MSVRAILLVFVSVVLVVFGGMALAAAVDGTPRDDRLQGTDKGDVMRGYEGDDRLQAGRGADLLRGDAGDDTMKAGEGSDEVYGGSDDDSMPAGTGGDRIYGGAGNDRLLGKEGADRAFGGPGDDYLRDDRAGEGSFRDELFGEDGDDTFEVSDDGGGRGVVDRIVCGSGTDTVTAGPEDDVAGDCEAVTRD